MDSQPTDQGPRCQCPRCMSDADQELRDSCTLHAQQPESLVDSEHKSSTNVRVRVLDQESSSYGSIAHPVCDQAGDALSVKGVDDGPCESSPLLLSHARHGHGDADADIVAELGAEIASEGKPLTLAWPREAKAMLSNSVFLIVTFFLQYSINFASIFSAGRLGKVELGAVALANMTTAVTCLAPFMGLATSLDTLCPQAFGDGHKHLVGIQCQRMVLFLSCMSVGVAALWMNSEAILLRLVDTKEAAQLASVYLKVMIFSLPGIIVFEAAKRILQAQGMFKENAYVLFVAAPINVFANWLLVWKLDMGFIGAPIAVAFSRNLMALLIVLYIRFIRGSQCWGGLSSRAFTNWWPMFQLALPGMIMVEAEWLAFEIMTFVSSRFGTDYLAAQSILITLTTIVYHLPFALSVASSTRIANLIGANMVDSARIAAKVAVTIVSIACLLNLMLNILLRFQLPRLLSSDDAVVAITAQALPLVAFVQVFDGLSAGAHGILRGIGKQSIGGPANLFAYYVISLPLSMTLLFRFGWKLEGLWLGLVVGLITVSLIEYGYLLRTDWHQAAAKARARNATN